MLLLELRYCKKQAALSPPQTRQMTQQPLQSKKLG
jgi:hypothetical protein